jgi:hypothetical protein
MHAIAEGLREEFVAVEAPTGTRGGTTIRGSSVGINSVNVTPYILVEAPNGTIDTAIGMDPRRTTHEYALHANNALDLEFGVQEGWYVLKSWILSYEPTSIEVGGTPYYAWHFPVAVHTSQEGGITP